MENQSPTNVATPGKHQKTQSCSRKLYTPSATSRRSITRAADKVKTLRRELCRLEERIEIYRRRGQKLAEYRVNMRKATVEAVKCMYEEYIQRKLTYISSRIAERPLTQACLEEIVTPPRNRMSEDCDGQVLVGLKESPLATPLE